jgi:hypothetical protein
MKLHRLATLVFALAAAGAVHAQTLTANVPFQFVVNGQTLAAGSYAVSEASPRTLIVQGRGTKGAAAALAVNFEPASSQLPAKLVFHRYGDRYFLAQVWIPGKHHSTFKPTSAERELNARGSDPGEAILVALR